MEMTFINFWQEIVRNPMLFITVLLTLGVIFVTGQMHRMRSPPVWLPDVCLCVLQS